MIIDTLMQQPCHWVLCASFATEISEQQQSWLSAEERDRWQRFRRSEDQQRYLLAHVLKRLILAKYLSLNPDELTFSTRDKGKPYCLAAGAPEFNLSHGGDWVLLGLSSDCDIGVDVEAVSRMVGDSIYDYVLSEEQRTHVVTARNPKETFLIYWTQKEAISKAFGAGLSIDFQTLECSGELGSCLMAHRDQELKVYTRELEEDYAMSAALTSTAPEPNWYRLARWDDSDCWVERLS